MRPGNTTVLRRPLKFTTPTLLNLIRRRGGEPHNTLADTPTWYDENARRILDQQVNAVLAQHGLMGPRGMDRDLLVLLEAISRPQLEYYGWFEGRFENAPTNFSVLAGSGNGGAFVLVRMVKEDTVIVAPERPEELLQGFINQIPPARPGSGQPLVVGKNEYLGKRRADDEGGFSIMQTAPGRGPQSPIKEIKRIMNAERTGGGSLYVAVRNRAGTRRRSERPLNFVDTAEGRWLMEERPGRGEPLLVFTPATPQVIADRLRNAQSTLG
jgi:ESX secretion-associated protein EspG